MFVCFLALKPSFQRKYFRSLVHKIAQDWGALAVVALSGTDLAPRPIEDPVLLEPLGGLCSRTLYALHFLKNWVKTMTEHGPKETLVFAILMSFAPSPPN